MFFHQNVAKDNRDVFLQNFLCIPNTDILPIQMIGIMIGNVWHQECFPCSKLSPHDIHILLPKICRKYSTQSPNKRQLNFPIAKDSGLQKLSQKNLRIYPSASGTFFNQSISSILLHHLEIFGVAS